MANDTVRKTITVAILLCIVCSVLVSTAAVKLKPLQLKNKALFTKTNIIKAAGLTDPSKSVDELFKKIEVKYVDLQTGEFTNQFKEKTYNLKDILKDPEKSIPIKKEDDLANIKRRAKTAIIYLVREGGQLKTIILPVYGKGLWSTMYAFLALEADGNTVKGLRFYDQGETPGLGGEIENQLWLAQWSGKKIYNSDGTLSIQVLKGNVDQGKPEAIHQIDGLSGATLTTKGVHNLFRYWMGKNGFKRFLSRLKEEGA